MRTLLSIAVVVLVTTSPSLSAEPAHDDPTVVATVAGAPITALSLQREMARQGGHDPSRFDEPDEKISALDALIRTEVLARAAIDAGLDKDPAIQDEYKHLLAQRYWASVHGDREPIRATDEEVQNYYESHSAEFEQPKQIRGSIALLRARSDAGDADRQSLHARAESLAVEVASGRTTFPDMAREHSEERFSRARGGDIGWMTPEHRVYRWEKAVIEALSAIESPGEDPRVVETERGVYLVQLTGRRGGDMLSLDSVRSRIKKTIVAERRRERDEAELTELNKRYPLEVYEDRLMSITPAAATVGGSGPPAFPVGQVTLPDRPGTDGESSGGTR